MDKDRKRKQMQQWSVRRDVCWALALKGALLFALYLLCFGASHRVSVDAPVVANALLGSSAGEIHR